MQAILYVGHGSRVEKGRRQAIAFMKKCTEDIAVPIREFCFLELSKPAIEDGISRCIERGASHIAVFPLLLLAAGHAKEDIPAKLEEAERQYPDIVFTYGQPFGVHDAIVDILMERISEKDQVTDGDSVLLVGRGSSDPAIKEDFGRIRRLLEKKYPFRSVQTAYLAATKPSFEEGLERACEAGNSRIFVLPYLLFTGVLMNEMAKSVEERHAHKPKFVLCESLGYHPNFKTLVQQKAGEITNLIERPRTIIHY